ncbi:MAG: hypothetical protein HYY24_04320 [Verrucomicrobia bacterium]|nr:hypothetical protein [Verrucomicrobiota bacterium]
MQIIIRFSDQAMKRSALGRLVGRFPGKSWASGEMMVPEQALAFLTSAGIRFTAEGPATHDQIASLRNPAAVAL